MPIPHLASIISSYNHLFATAIKPSAKPGCQHPRGPEPAALIRRKPLDLDNVETETNALKIANMSRYFDLRIVLFAFLLTVPVVGIIFDTVGNFTLQLLSNLDRGVQQMRHPTNNQANNFSNNMPVTIYEVAERAGVSSSTVARIMRGDVKEAQERSAETARRVRKIAKELGYRTNRRAQALSRGETRGIGLLYSSDRWLFEGVNTQVINSLVAELQGEGYHLVFVPIGGGDGWEDIIRGGQIDGAVTFQPLSQHVSTALAESNVGVVSLADDSDASLSQVLVDDFAGASAAVRHLLKLGHRKLLYYVHESVKQHCSVHERQRGYTSAIADHGPGVEATALIFAPEEEAMSLLVGGESGITGVLCYSNLEATLLCHDLWQYGVDVPGEISIVGFNDMFSTKYMTPPLTTVAFDAERIGKIGADLILNTIGTKSTPKNSVVMTIKPKLIVRGSTGPPPSR